MGNCKKTLGKLLGEGMDCNGLFFRSYVQVNGSGSMHYAYESSEDNKLKVFPRPGEYDKPVGLNLDQHMNDPQVEESEIKAR